MNLGNLEKIAALMCVMPDTVPDKESLNALVELGCRFTSGLMGEYHALIVDAVLSEHITSRRYSLAALYFSTHNGYEKTRVGLNKVLRYIKERRKYELRKSEKNCCTNRSNA